MHCFKGLSWIFYIFCAVGFYLCFYVIFRVFCLIYFPKGDGGLDPNASAFYYAVSSPPASSSVRFRNLN